MPKYLLKVFIIDNTENSYHGDHDCTKLTRFQNRKVINNHIAMLQQDVAFGSNTQARG
jgi:hypothetical protein